MSVRLRQAGLTLLGLYVCLAASIAHRQTADVAGLELPWGIALGFIAVYSTARAVSPWVRSGELFFALGWTLGLTLPMLSPGGSYLIAQDWLGLTFMFGSVALLGLAIIRSGRSV